MVLSVIQETSAITENLSINCIFITLILYNFMFPFLLKCFRLMSYRLICLLLRRLNYVVLFCARSNVA